MFRPPQLRAVWGRVALAAALLVAVPGVARAVRSRRVSGTIKDQQGGVVPGVTVTAPTRPSSPTSAVTDESGYFTLPLLTPSQYDIAAELDGFKKTTRPNVQLDAAASIGLDFTLETGAMTEVVTVTAEAPPLQTDVTIRKTVEAKDIEQLVVLGPQPDWRRRPQGRRHRAATSTTCGFGDLGNGGFNINGSRSDENNITIDGATAIRTRSSGNIIGIQNVDAVQEVQVLTANYMPEYGRASGGQIRFVTKSGSNRYSGSASYFLRDESLQANTLDAQPQHQPGREQRARRRSTTSSTATRSAVRFRAECSRTSCSSSARRNGWTSSSSRRAASRCRPRPCGAATSASC